MDSRATIDRAIIWRNCYIGERAEVRGAILHRQVSVKPQAMIFEGAVIGDETIIGEGAVIQPNVKIWPAKEIESGATVTSHHLGLAGAAQPVRALGRHRPGQRGPDAGVRGQAGRGLRRHPAQRRAWSRSTATATTRRA